VVIRNLEILTSLYQLSKRIPENYPQVCEQIQHSFPLIELETFAEQRFNQNQALSIESRMYGAINHNTNPEQQYISAERKFPELIRWKLGSSKVRCNVRGHR
jgi:hypothetical protein